MARDGSNIYSLPFPAVVSGTTISSNVHNSTMNDIAQDLNTPRPIVAGGTGATNADGALAAMGAEKSNQIVTNYDSHAWLAGSFSSAAGATAAPTANAFCGVVYMADSSNIVIEAREISTGTLYMRRKVAGAWVNSGAWAFDNVLQVAGGQTITGGFRFTPASLTLTGTVTPNALLANYQYGNNGAAFTLAAPAADSALDILVTNVSGAGTISFSGYTVGANTGDLLTNTVGEKFILSIRRINGTSTYVVKALQ